MANTDHDMKKAVKKASKIARKVTSKTDAKAKTKVAAKPIRERDPRLPPAGTVLKREHDGKVHEITVLDEGFKYQGKVHPSLSALAKEITGTIWNGFLWANLIKRPSKPSAVPAKEA